MNGTEHNPWDNAGNRSVHVLISGRVQGVGYRAWCAERAGGLGLSGWVRNLHKGEVEAVFCGSAAQVDAMVAAAAEGPDWARVMRVDVLGEGGELSGPFVVLPTA